MIRPVGTPHNIGGAQGGHYIVYIRPNPEGKWFKFDDNEVMAVSKEEAVDGNFGSSDTVPTNIC